MMFNVTRQESLEVLRHLAPLFDGSDGGSRYTMRMSVPCLDLILRPWAASPTAPQGFRVPGNRLKPLPGIPLCLSTICRMDTCPKITGADAIGPGSLGNVRRQCTKTGGATESGNL